MIKEIWQWLFKKEERYIKLGKFGILTSTDISIQNGINDKFNKKIIIYEGVEVNNNRIKYGKVIEEIPYTEEEVENLIKIKRIPIVERKINNEFEFEEGRVFGEVTI